MYWIISYKKWKDGSTDKTRCLFHEEPKIPVSRRFISAGTPDEAIECAVSYLTQFYQHKGKTVIYQDGDLRLFKASSQGVSDHYSDFQATRAFLLLGADRKPYLSLTPGKLGGHRGLKIYGRLDCPSALGYIKKGQYVKYRVFFADEATAIAAGFRPCSVCMPEKYKLWKSTRSINKT